MSTTRGLLAAALVMGLGSVAPIIERGMPAPIIQTQPRRTKAMKSGGYSFTTGEWSYLNKRGWSVAHGKRLATKARNVRRHKRANKGK